MTAACRVLVIGRDGQLARELAAAKWPDGWQIVRTGRPEIDLRDPSQAAAFVAGAAPDLVVNAAAYTAVDLAEREADIATKVNAESPGAIARSCAAIGAPFVTVSTDYVFDGSKPSPYIEDDPINPLGVYGRSKAEGEALVRDAWASHVSLRTSWVFSPFGTNFVRTMMRLGAERPALRIVADQRGCPTAAADLARAIVAVCAAIRAGQGAFGTFHAANAGPTSWYDFARTIFQGLAERGAKVPGEVTPIATSEYPTAAVRPANSVLDCGRLRHSFGVAMRPWHAALDECLDVLAGPRRSGRV